MKILVRDDGVIFGYHPDIKNTRFTVVEVDSLSIETDQEKDVTATQVGVVSTPTETKESLLAYAKEKFGVEIDKRLGFDKIKTKVSELEMKGV